MFSRVLVPTDGSQLATEALRVGERLAQRWDCELHVLTLIEPGQIESGIRHIIGRQVAAIETRPKVDIRPMSAGIAEDISAEFDRIDDTLIVMGTWGRGRSAGLVPNNAEQVLRLMRSPMIALGTGVGIRADWPSGPMLIAVDGSQFGEAVVQPAARLAEALGVGLRLITVIDADGSQGGQPAEANSLAELARMVESMTGRRVAHEVVKGHDPSRAIADCGRRYDASLIAMSTHGRSGFDRLASDSEAMDVVRHAGCPVFLHRPPVAED
ncbi:MAG: universal stress protein [Acidimicrobiales bacterium]